MFALLTLALLVALAWPGAGRAAAHANPVGTRPAYGTVLEPGQGEVSVTFDEPVTVAAGGLTVLGRDGERVATGDLRYADGDRTIRAALPAGLAEGTYLLGWVVLSADGHTIGGSSVFGVGTPPDTTVRAPDPDPLLAALDTMVRLLSALGYLGIVLGVGVPVAVAICGPAPRAPVRQLGLVGAVLVTATAAAELVLTPGRLAGAAGWTDPGTWSSALTSGPGLAALGSVLGGMLLVLALGGRGRPTETASRVVLAGGGYRAAGVCAAVLIVVSVAVSGHAVAAPDPALAVVVTVVHLAAMTVWGGGLVAALLLWRGRDQTPALRRFASVALGAVAVLAGTGAVQAWRAVDPVASLWDTGWGRLLLLKLGSVAAALAVGGLIRRHLRARPGVPARRWLRAETAAVGAVLLVSALLSGTAPARDTYDPPWHATLALGEVTAVLDIDGAKAGEQELTVHLRDHTGAALEVRDLAARLTRADGDVPLELDFRRVTPPDRAPDFFAATTRVPGPGEWKLRVTVTVDRLTAHTATIPYRVY
ncbi:copper resistance CopC/CopD family protein [Nocardia thailandica]|uniref:Copper resistance CopC/CopD family protein n=1 Tax=Nocardia thailandica TaxID=257275 RepID=A0ABW6PMX8_9NOCA